MKRALLCTRRRTACLFELEVCGERLPAIEGQIQRVAAGRCGRGPVVDVLPGRGVIAQARTAGCGCLEWITAVARKGGARHALICGGCNRGHRADVIAIGIGQTPFDWICPAGFARIEDRSIIH